MSSVTRADGGAPHRRRRRGRAFRPGAWLTVCALLGVALLLALGTWQVQRLQWKTALIAGREARLAAAPAPLPADVADWDAWDFRRVVVADGEFLPERAQRFGVRAAEGGRVGHDLLVPLRLADGRALLVNVGVVAASPGEPEPVAVEPPPVGGILRYRGDAAPASMTPDNDPAEGLWHWYDLPALRDATGLELLPVVLDATAAPAGVDLPNNHLQYAVTWYTLAAALAVIYVAVGFQRGREGEEKEAAPR